MNKQELIERIKKLDEPYLKAEFVLELVKQLDEPQPVKVKQFVADWYEKKKHDLNHYIWDYIYNWNHRSSVCWVKHLAEYPYKKTRRKAPDYRL